MAINETSPGMVLDYDGPLVIVGGGTVDQELLKRLHKRGAVVVAADGGAHNCAKVDIVPRAIIGDMDSLENQDDWAAITQVLKFSEQETTDFEKCLYSTRAPVTIALGMTGKRFDHTLATLDAIARYAQNRHIILVDEEDIALGVTGVFSFEVAAGDRVSVHPLVSVKFKHSDGLKYPLDGLTLAPGVRTGTSNSALEGSFSVAPEAGENGAWLLLLDQRYLDDLIEKF